MTGTTRESSQGEEDHSRSEAVEAVEAAEPWDERPRESSGLGSQSSATKVERGRETMRRDAYQENEDFEDGDLPALNLSSSVDPINGQRMLRALSPPHRQGSNEIAKQREFWSQLDAPSSSLEGSDRRQIRNQHHSTEDDIPEDERASLRAESRDEYGNVLYRPKKSELRNANESHHRRIKRVESDEETEDSKEYVLEEDEQADFCGYTLSTMEQICGEDVVNNFCAPSGERKHIEAPSKPKPNLSILNIKDDDTTNAVEEHTAIEVEYVEPEEPSTAAQDKPENWSPTRKNAYLAAMARKAKEDFEKSHAKDDDLSPKRKSPEVQEPSAEDVYNGFTATEKRKFLRLINSGLTSTESAEQVRAERELKEKSDAAKKSVGKTKGGLFKFWKKGTSKAKGSDFEPTKGGIPEDEVGSLKLYQEEKKEEELGSHTSASRAHSVGSADTSEDLAQVESMSSNYAKSEMATAKSERSAIQELPENEQPEIKKNFSSNEARSSSGSNPDFEGRFARSGVNYYDAVRRDQSETDDDDMEAGSNLSVMAKKRASKPTRLGPILPSQKLKGFSRLDKAEESGASTDNSEGSSHKKPSVTTASVGDGQGEGGARPSQTNDNTSSEEMPSPPATGKTVEAEAFGKIERELLRPIGQFSSPTTSNHPGVHLVTPQSTPATYKAKQIEKVGNAAIVSPGQNATPNNKSEPEGFNLQEYLDSTDLYSTPGAGNDGHSVVSGMDRSVDMSSGVSVYSHSSAVTQSTRKRRPGAAKTRLAKAKQAENHASKKNGWHETIRAAAESTHRVWQPKVGWVDYEDPDASRDTEENTVSMAEKIHLNLGIAKTSKHNSVGGTAEQVNHSAHSPAKIAFPEKWESERQSMLALPDAETKHPEEKSSAQLAARSSIGLEVKSPDTADFGHSGVHRSIQQPFAGSDEISPRDPSGNKTVSVTDFDAFAVRPEIPSAKISSQPVKQKSVIVPFDDMSIEQSVAQSVEHFVGYVASTPPRARTRTKKTELSPSHGKRSVVSASKMSGWMESMQAATANVGHDGRSWDPVEGWSNVDDQSLGFDVDSTDIFGDQQRKKSSINIENEIAEGFHEGISGSRNVVASQVPTETYTHLANLTPDLPPIMKKNTGAAAGAGEDKTDNASSDGESEDDEAPLLSTSGSFPDDGINTPAVHVVKEKVDEEDINWFPQTRRGSNNKKVNVTEKISDASYYEQSTATTRTANTTRTYEYSAVTQSSAASMQYSVSSSVSPRRGRGPVDVDEVTEDMDSEEEQPEGGVHWNGVAFESDSYVQGSSASAKPSDAIKSHSSTSSVNSLPIKPVPKLSCNKRDTSPIRGRNSVDRDSSSYDSNTADAPVDTPQRTSASKDDFHEGSGHNYMDPHDSQQSASPQDSTLHAGTLKLSHGQATTASSKAKARAQQWETVTSNVAPGDFLSVKQVHNSGVNAEQNHGENPPNGSFASAEWKSFLGKKVREESAAAARQHGGQSKDDLRGLQHPLSNNQYHQHGSKELPEESVFEFSVNDGAFPTSPSLLGSPSRKNLAHESQDQCVGTEPLEVSVAGSSDFSDGNQIGKPFLKRLAACAAPMAQTGQNISENMQAHLAFLRPKPEADGAKNDSAGARFVPQYLCGRPDVITEEEDEDVISEKPSKDSAQESSDNKRSPERPRPQPKENLKIPISTRGSEVKADTRSVISEDFGAKTAYLEALAMKTAVSKPRRSDGRRRSSASDAGTSTTSSSHIQKEKWRALLERKREAGVSPSKPRPSGSSEVSEAAEKYAAEQVEAMMAAMSSSRSKSTPRSWRSDNADAEKKVEDMIRDSSYHTSPQPDEYRGYDVIRRRSDFDQTKEAAPRSRADSIKAAEDLAAARVEAMMKALAGPAHDEGEI